MTRKLKIGGIALASVILVVVVVAGLLIVNIDPIVRTAVETYGSDITRAEVTLNEVDISPTSGTATLAGLSVGNPAGFETRHALRLGAVSVAFDITTVTEDIIVIHEIDIGAPEITLEIGPRGSNIDVLKRNATAYSGGAADGAGGAAASPRGGPRFIVENLHIRNGRVNIAATLLSAQTISTALPDIHLKDLGRKQGGATAGDIILTVLESVGKAASDAAIVGAPAAPVEMLDRGLESGAGALNRGAEKVGRSLERLLGR